MSNSIYKYINIDSTYRNRNDFPNSSDFVIPVTFTSSNSSNFLSQNPVSNSFPTETSTLQAGSTTTSLVLSATSSSIDNFYVNQLITVSGEVSTITAYSGTTKTATISPAFLNVYGAGTAYSIGKQSIITSGTFQLNTLPPTTRTLVKLDTNASTTNQAYKGSILYCTSGVNNGQFRIITNYVGADRLATLSSPLLDIPVYTTDTYEILAFTYDSNSSIVYSGTKSLNQAVSYSIELLYVMLPNQLLKSGYGGTLDKYPYFIIKFFNADNQYADNVIYTNNPNEYGALFRVPMPLTLKSETFFILRDSKCIQVVKFKPDQNLRFQILLPSGEPIVFATDDNKSPSAPNPFLQISASFAIRRID
jgi:hypothetical protein